MYVLGIDIGTTGTKSMLISEHGKVLTSAYKEYSLITPTGFVEQDVRDWWETVVSTVRECMKSLPSKDEVRALSMSTQGGSMVMVDENCEPLDNAITWMDTRGAKQEEELDRAVGAEKIYLTSGWRLSGTLMATKFVWLREHKPELFAKAHKFLTTVDYVNYKLTGRYVIDHTNAGITQIFDMNTGAWDPALLEACGISEAVLPEVVPSGEVIGNLCAQAAEELGLSTDVVVVSGAHDQYAAATGAGALNPGDVLLSTGTAWAPLGISAEPMFDTKNFMGVGRHVKEGRYGVLSTVSTAGVCLEWLRKNFGRQKIAEGTLRLDSFAEIDMEASKRRGNTEGLFFYPQFGGSGYPRWNGAADASFIGLTLGHDFYDLALAVMEGVAFEMKQILDGYASNGLEAKSLRLVGGASKSPLWTEIISNVTGLPITRFKEPNIACIGAAALAGKGCGMFQTLEEASAGMCDTTQYPAPEGALRDYYRAKNEQYLKKLEFIEKVYQI